MREELTAVVEQIEILPPASFRFAGSSFVEADLAAAIQRLSDQLYERSYCRRSGDAPGVDGATQDSANFEAELSRANASRPHWESGWIVRQASAAGVIAAQKHGITRTFWPGEYVTFEGPGLGPVNGAAVDVFFAAESRRMQSGFYFAFGETVADEPDEASLVRFYWNVRANGACDLVARLTCALNRFQVPFRLKILNDPKLYGRADAAVLFASKRHYQITAGIALETQRDLLPHLGLETALLTKPLAHGLGFAEDPGNGESFGMNRCRMLANAIWRAGESGRASLEERVEAIADEFAAQGVDLERPYLNPGSVDQFEIECLARQAAQPL